MHMRGGIALLVAAAARAEPLTVEIQVDAALERLSFDRCAHELVLVELAHAFVHRPNRTLLLAKSESSAAAQSLVDYMRLEQTKAAGPPCAETTLPEGALPPVRTGAVRGAFKMHLVWAQRVERACS